MYRKSYKKIKIYIVKCKTPCVIKFQGDVLLFIFGAFLQQMEGEITGTAQFSVVFFERSAAMIRVIHSMTRVKNSKISFLICIAVV